MVKVAAVQFVVSASQEENIATGERLIRQAALDGANIILLQELFMGYYFCQEQKDKYFSWAFEFSPEHPIILRFVELAKELNVCLPISFFEVKNNVFFNSIAIIDADGTILGTSFTF
jgi:N-carbamoylputrescine amidase